MSIVPRIKTLCFPLRLNKEQAKSLEGCLQKLRWVWNDALDLLIEKDDFSGNACVEEKDGEKIYFVAPCCPLPWQYRRIDKNKPWADGNYAPYSPISHTRSWRRGDPLFTQPIRRDYQIPRLQLTGTKGNSEQKLFAAFAYKRQPEKPWLREISQCYIRGLLASLYTAWDRYKDKTDQTKKPKFKSARDPVLTLINENDTDKIKVTPSGGRDGVITIAGLGKLKVKYLWRDWGNLAIKSLKISKQPDGYYLQLTGEVPTKQYPEKKNRIIGLALPQEGLLAVSDSGKEYSAAVQPDNYSAKLLKLQNVLSRQEKGSKRWEKTKNKIARLYAEQARRTKCNHQKISTFISRTYGQVYYQSVNSKMCPKPMPEIHYDPDIETPLSVEYKKTGAEKIAERNQKKARIATGSFVALIKQKSVVASEVKSSLFKQGEEIVELPVIAKLVKEKGTNS